MGVQNYEEFERKYESQEKQHKKVKRKTIQEENEEIEMRLTELGEMGLPMGFGKKKNKK